jgi:ribosomal peptide maturation radical SAM protein 1
LNELAEHPLDVALVAMPFAPIQIPSLGLALLHGALTQRSITTKTFHFSIRFAVLIGTKLYDQISDGEPARNDLVGEWIFNDQVFDPTSLDTEGYIREVLHGTSPYHKTKRFRHPTEIHDWAKEVQRVRSYTGQFLDECVTSLLSVQPRIVGITSVFQEHVAALALAKRIKQAQPHIVVVLGGSNCEGPMGLETARQFPFVDAVVSGEGDIAFPDFVEQIMGRQPANEIQGIYRSVNVGPGTAPAVTVPVQDLDDLPFPNFDDHVTQLQAERPDFRDIAPPHLMFETARGCWWGQVNHCTFCGLNGATMKFRSKSPKRALEELKFLADKYPGRPIAVSDNIMDMKYLKDFVPALVESKLGLSIFYEVKSNLKKQEIDLLKRAGIDRIQPGIESFSSPILKLMRKGVTGLQNIQTLKWCRELAVRAEWGILWGFPGEDPSEYTRMAALLPLLTHLTPPIGVSQIRLDRFSPNHTNKASGFINVRPFPAYSFVYPLDAPALQNLAYFFSYDLAIDHDPSEYTKPVLNAVSEWRSVSDRSALFWVDTKEALLIWDSRPVAKHPLYVVSEPSRSLYLLCDRVRTPWHLHDDFLAKTGQDLSTEEIEECLKSFIEWGLMVADGQSYLSLGIRLGEYELSELALSRFLTLAKGLGSGIQDEIIIALSNLTAIGNSVKVVANRQHSTLGGL